MHQFLPKVWSEIRVPITHNSKRHVMQFKYILHIKVGRLRSNIRMRLWCKVNKLSKPILLLSWKLRFSWVWNLGCDSYASLYTLEELSVISFSPSLRWQECGHLSSSYSNLSHHLLSGKKYVIWVFDKHNVFLEKLLCIKNF